MTPLVSWGLNITQLNIDILQEEVEVNIPQNDKTNIYHCSSVPLASRKMLVFFEKKGGIIRKLEAARRTGEEILGYPFSSFSTISTNNCICNKNLLLCWECAAACSVARHGRRWSEAHCSPPDVSLLLVATLPPWKWCCLVSDCVLHSLLPNREHCQYVNHYFEDIFWHNP